MDQPVNEHFPLPIFLNISGQKCVIVGGGTVALRKVTDLLEAGTYNIFWVDNIDHATGPHDDILKLYETVIWFIRGNNYLEMVDENNLSSFLGT